MEKFLIKGPCKIKGKVNISGSKNSSLSILCACILFDKNVEIKNLPRVQDIETMLEILSKSLGFKIKNNKKNKSVILSIKKQHYLFLADA